ncbi:MAG: histidine--tRNA ligase [Candidatus Saccharimonas sp.]
MSKLLTASYKGARDWYPEDIRIRNYIFDTWRKVALSYGYEEYDAPLLEPIEIYEAKSGQELVSEQTYQFTDRGDRRVAIRPEMTPSVSRMLAAKRQETPLPARWFSIAQFMRYERPQRGRDREFWQLNCDIFGDESVLSEAEIIVMASDLLKAFGASDDQFVIRINNRRIINFMMAQYLSLDSGQAQLMIKLFDRRNKVSAEDFRDQAGDIFGRDNSEVGLRKLTQLLAARSMADLPEEIRESNAVKEVQDLFTQLERAGLKNAVFDISLMRGLDYYTGIVFEVFDTHPENTRSLFGGGRYDGLVGMFGAEPLSAVGFAPGLSTVQLFLETHKLLPDLGSATDIYAIPIGDSLRGTQKLVTKLRQQNIRVELDFSERKFDKQLKTAIKKQIPYVLFVGEDELSQELYTLKNITTGTEEKLIFDDIVKVIHRNHN